MPKWSEEYLIKYFRNNQKYNYQNYFEHSIPPNLRFMARENHKILYQ